MPIRYFRLLDYLSSFALLCLYFLGAWLIGANPAASWIDLITDDAYYYLGIVRSIVEVGSSSFLPPYETNGYQPLWVMLLTASAFVFGTSEKSLAIQMYTLCFVFVGIFAYLSKRNYGLAFPAILSAAVFSSVTLDGMETAMMAVYILAFFNAKDWKYRGIFSSLIFLTRLDALALVAARDCYLFLHKKERDFKHYWILIPVVVIYAFVNYHSFGSFVPVSGLAKSVGNIPGENFIKIFSSYASQLKVPILILVTVFISSALLSRNTAIKFKDELIVLFISFLIIAGYYGTLSGWPLWPWYHWPAMMIFFYAVTEAASHLSQLDAGHRGRNRTLTHVAFLTFFAVLSYSAIPAVAFSRTIVGLVLRSNNPIQSFLRSRDPIRSFGIKNLELVAYIKENKFPGGTFFAMGDRAGSFGFFLGRNYRFLHTEGLVGPYEYYEYLKNDIGEEFLNSQKIDYLIAERDNFFEAKDIIGVAEPIQGLSSHFGPYLLCFDRKSIILDQTWMGKDFWGGEVMNKRYLIAFSGKIACPADMIDSFKKLRQSYGALRRFTLPSEYEGSHGAIQFNGNY